MTEAGSKDLLEVLTPGALTSLQDKGRHGYQSLGIAEAGAMDAWSLVAANRLAGNPDNAAALEITIVGPKLRFLAPAWFSLAGADAESHDGLRGRGTFAAALDSIRTFVSQRSSSGHPPVLVNYLLTPASFPSLPKALALCSKLGVDALVATHLVHVGTETQKRLACCDPGRGRGWLLFRSRLAVLWRRTQLVLPGMKPSALPVCPKNPLENLFVASDGAVSPCVYLCPPIRGGYSRRIEGVPQPQQRLAMGSLERQSLIAIWNRPDYRHFRAQFQRRVDLYQALMPPPRTDFEGLQQLQGATDRIQAAFETPTYRPPEPCRGCPHLWGY